MFRHLNLFFKFCKFFCSIVCCTDPVGHPSRGIPPVALQGKWAPSLLAARDAARSSGAHDTAAAILRGLSAVGICLCGRGRSIRDPSGYTFRVPQCATAEDYEMAIVDAYAALPLPAV